MRAWPVEKPAPIGSGTFSMTEREPPQPGRDEVRVRVRACGVCRTDLHLVEGDLQPRRPGVVPGHQAVGVVDQAGPEAGRFSVGDRVGVAWLRRTCGRCRWCRQGAENLCPASQYTGWDSDGGFADHVVAPEAFVHRLPERYDDIHVAPLLCAGIIGYRALVRAALPPGGRLGLYGFGSSAHITAQVALAGGAELFVMSRGEASRALAREMGATWVGAATDRPPAPLDSAIVFAPAGELVPVALEALERGGTLALAGIHMTDVPALDHQRHLFLERDLRTVSSNTRRDADELLRLADRLPLQVHASAYPFAETDRALADLAAGRVSGSLVVTLT